MPRLISHHSPALKGHFDVPGDKSISHRAVLLGLLAAGKTEVTGLLEGEDVLATAAAARALGADVVRHAPGHWTVHGVGLGALRTPDQVLDMGNSGTACRLLMGVLASHPLTAMFSGDASLSKRPMGRVIDPLTDMGATFVSRDGRLPLTMTGRAPALPIVYKMPVASAQVKSAILLAALNTPGRTTVIETAPTRDHSERMLRGFGAALEIEELDGAHHIHVTGEAELTARAVTVPGDPSSAAFAVVAATLAPGSEVLVRNVGMNPTRTGLYEVLEAMGADIAYENRREVAGEPVADLRVRSAALTGVEVPPEIAPRMIDEYPILSIAAAAAEGVTVMRGVEELRVKETDRIAAMAAGLKANGVTVSETEDSMTVEGRGAGGVQGGAMVKTHLDHRIAMSFAVLGAVAAQPVIIDDSAAIATSFPSFAPQMQALGMKFEAPDRETAA